tara:strand:+ start:825 stop:1733 length:909 start_codon:yes stop_codon:yes gene_type:complete
MKTTLVSKYDYLFKHNIENHVKNIIIYTENDNWSINQDYSNIDIKEHNIWKNLFNKVYDDAFMYGTDMYRKGMNILADNIDNFKYQIPNLSNISKIIYKNTQWNIKVVAGFVDEVIFFELLKEKNFPSSDIIRLSQRFYDKYKNTNVRNDLSYTPEPDIFHEIFGHAPFLLDKKYAQLMNDIGSLGYDIIFNENLSEDLKSHNLKRLQNFVWWTLEFGLIKSSCDLGYEIYGAGILSSYNEIQNVIKYIKSKDKNVIEYDIEKVVMNRFDYSDLQDRYYAIESFDTLVDSFYSNKDIFLYKG